jgi:hypothetical protein
MLASTLCVAMVAGTPLAALTQDGPSGDDGVIAEWDAFIAEAAEALETERFDRLHPEVVVEATAGDPDALVEWVAAETRWVPYRGALRGAAGVLLDRTGSNLDRALLLADLLTRAGHDVRLAHAQLPVDTARVALEVERARPAAVIEEVPILLDEAEHRDARDRIPDHAGSLVELSGLRVPGVDPEAAIGEISDHWWVQASIDGDWVDLDPLLRGDDPAIEAAETMAAADLPDALRHAVTVRVVAERWSDHGVDEQIVLEHTERLAGVEALPALELTMGVASETAAIADDASPLDVADAATHWRPTLATPGDRLVGEWFSVRGDLEPPDPSLAGGAFGEGLGALDGMAGAPDDSGSVLSAVWLEYELSRPGAAPYIERREIVDLLGGQRRSEAASIEPRVDAGEATERGLALSGSTSILLQNADAQAVHFVREGLRDLVDNRNAYIASALLALGSDDERIMPALSRASWRPLEVLGAITLRSTWGPNAESTYVGSPGVWTAHSLFDVVDGTLGYAMAIDVVQNPVEIFPALELDAARIRLEQGILDTMVEAVMLGDAVSPNTWRRFDARDADDDAWEAWRSAAEFAASTAFASMPPAERARITEALMRGYLVVAATAPVTVLDEPHATWWRIDPEDGTTLGIGYRGWGSETTETLATNQPGQSAILRLCSEAELRRETIMNIATVLYNMDRSAEGLPGATPIPPGAPGYRPPCFRPGL